MPKKDLQKKSNSPKDLAPSPLSDDLEPRGKFLDPSRVALVPPSLFNGLPAFLVQSQDRSKTYLVLDNVFCSCPDFITRSLLRSEKPYCYHIEGIKIIQKSAKENMKVTVSLSRLTDIRSQVPWL